MLRIKMAFLKETNFSTIKLNTQYKITPSPVRGVFFMVTHNKKKCYYT